MRGTGKLQVTTSDKPSVRLLDITRLVRRSGRILTGVDRVERAYARALFEADQPCYGIARTKLGYALVAPEHLWALVQRLCGDAKIGGIDLQARLTIGMTAQRRTAESEVRRCALARCRPKGLEKMLGQHLNVGFIYVNVGHSNLTSEIFSALNGQKARSAVMIHDLIPLEFPQTQRAGQTVRFREMLARVAKGADLIICNSVDTAAKLDAHLVSKEHGEIVVAHLGVDPPPPLPAEVSLEQPERPYFVSIGTIEPRKNHGFLLDLWEKMGADAPKLFLCGRRGWLNEDAFARLDRLAPDDPVQEMNDLSDADLAALLSGSNGLLMPSFGEGFGLPVVEAVRSGVPVLANDLPVYRETVGNIPIYADVRDAYLWEKHIWALAEAGSSTRQERSLDRLTWAEHFKTVLRLI